MVCPATELSAGVPEGQVAPVSGFSQASPSSLGINVKEFPQAGMADCSAVNECSYYKVEGSETHTGDGAGRT